MLQVRPIKTARCYSRSAEKREAFAAEMSAKFGVPVEPVESGAACVAGMDVVCTITSANDPVLKGEWLEPGMHLNAIGATSLYRREVDEQAVKRSGTIVVENRDQAKHECGELIYAAERGILRWSRVHELGQVVSGAVPGRRAQDEITQFNGLGVASEDVAVAAYVHKLALERGMGVELPIPDRL
jgi:ornithine cyclodeaminase/alanine dehydrogenase-like protein (mu-crystallin family)